MADEKLTVAVLMGGRSGEHDVSRASGWAVLGALDPEQFTAIPVLIGRDGEWRFVAWNDADPEGTGQHVEERTKGLELPEGLRVLLSREPDVVFIAMHGPEGEDGKLQALMELVGLPYVGSDSYASSLAMNKPMAKAVYRAHGIPVADDWLIPRSRWEADPQGLAAELRERFEAPWVLKTPKLGSSVGLAIVPATGDLEATLAELFAVDDQLFVEQYVEGTELTCAVLDTPALGETRATPLIEIVPLKSHYFDFETKYDPEAVDEICPARVSDEVVAEVQRLALAAHRALGCRGVSRTDFILRPDGSLVTLETNTIPGLTRASLLPQQAAEGGLPFDALVAGLIRGAHRQA